MFILGISVVDFGFEGRESVELICIRLRSISFHCESLTAILNIVLSVIVFGLPQFV